MEVEATEEEAMEVEATEVEATEVVDGEKEEVNYFFNYDWLFNNMLY